MASDFRYTRGVTAITAAASDITYYLTLNGNGLSLPSTEAPVQALIRQAYTGKNLFVYCVTRTGTYTATVALRESGVTSALTVSVTATGIFEDTVNTEALDDGDLVNYIVTTSGVGHSEEFTITTISCVLSHASADWPVLIAGLNSAGATATAHYPISGGVGTSTTEAWRQRTARASATLSNLSVYCSDSSATVTTRVNAAPGGQTVSPNATGLFEDTVGTDTVAAGDEINYALTAGTSQRITVAQVLSSSMARQAIAVYGTSAAFGVTTYFSPDGSTTTTTEAIAGVTQRTTNVLKNGFCYVSAYTLDVAATVDLRINAASSAVTMAPNATGVFEDTTNSVTLVATDEANYRLLTTAASSGALTVQLISVEETQPSTGAAVEATPKGVGVLTASVVPNIPFTAALQRYNWQYV